MIDLESPPTVISPDEQLNLVTSLWKTLLAHDEIIAARNLLNAVPWAIRDRKEIQKMIEITSPMLSHVDRRERMEEIYQTYGNEAIPLEVEIPPAWPQAIRLNFAISQIKNNHTVLDIGCMEGWLTNRVGIKTTAKAFGIDLSLVAIDIARQRATQFNTGARFAVRHFGDKLPETWPKIFDTILLFEIYEHVNDTKKLLQIAFELLSPGGKLLLTTPRGSWCQGFPVAYHEAWNSSVPREHVRAPIVKDVRDDLLSVGFVQTAVEEKPMPNPDVPGQATIIDQGVRP